MRVINSPPSRSASIKTLPAASSSKKHVSKESRLFKTGLLYSVLRYGVMLVSGVGYSLICAHLLGAKIVGTVALLTSILGIFRPLSSLGEQFALVPLLNRYAKDKPTARTLFWTTVLLSALLTLLVSIPFGLITSSILAQVYHHQDLTSLLFIYIVGFYSIYNLVLLFVAPYQAYQELKYVAITELLTGILKIGLLLTFIYIIGPSPLAAVLALVVGFLFSWLVLLPGLSSHFRFYPIRFAPIRYRSELGEIYRYSLKSLPAHASISILQHADRLVLGYYTSPAILGVYTLAYSVFERILMMGTSYENMIFSSASKLAANRETARLGEIYRSAIRSSLFWISLLVLLLSTFSHELLSLFGTEFTKGAVTLVLLLLGLPFDNFARITTGVMGGVNVPGLKAMIITTGALVNLVLNLCWIPIWGMRGAGAANTVGYIVTAALCLLWIIKGQRVTLLNKPFAIELALFGVSNVLFLILLLLVKSWLYQGSILAVFALILVVTGYGYFARCWMKKNGIFQTR